MVTVGHRLRKHLPATSGTPPRGVVRGFKARLQQSHGVSPAPGYRNGGRDLGWAAAPP